MSVINTNYLALVSQNNLNKSQSALGSAIERLSSGLRINSAKDDAAGQAIANRFTANIKGLSQASRNANDGISLAQTTEGALNEINNNLQRIRELTVQAANGTNSASDLDSIQAEIKQRLDEIDRVSEQTQFNGVKVLTKNDAMSIQVGAHDNETISVGLKKIDAKTLGLAGFDITNKPTFDAANLVETKEKDLAVFMGKSTVSGDKIDVKELFVGKGMGTTAPTEAKTVVDKTTGQIYLQVTATEGATRVEVGKSLYIAVQKGDLEMDADGKLSIKEADFSNVKPIVAKVNSLAAVDKALSDVDALRSDLGAVQNRFQSTITNLNNTVNNLSAARSRIEDADYAVEVSNMTRAQILQQAGTAVLAQANQVPQTALSLLR